MLYIYVAVLHLLAIIFLCLCCSDHRGLIFFLSWGLGLRTSCLVKLDLAVDPCVYLIFRGHTWLWTVWARVYSCYVGCVGAILGCGAV